MHSAWGAFDPPIKTRVYQTVVRVFFKLGDLMLYQIPLLGSNYVLAGKKGLSIFKGLKFHCTAYLNLEILLKISVSIKKLAY